MACGVAVACSDRGPLPEVAGDAALLFNPDDPNDIRDKLVDILTDESIKNSLINNGRNRVGMFSWQKHAAAIIELYENRKKKR